MADAPRPPRRQAPPGDAAGRRRAAARRRLIRRRRAAALAVLVLIVVVALLLVLRPGAGGSPHAIPVDTAALLRGGSPAVTVNPDGDGIKLATFLGTESRRFYGVGPAPTHLHVIWKTRIGGGWTSGRFSDDPAMYWSGTGWTGTPALVRDGGRLYLLIGGYDHDLRKVDAETGEVVWRYDFGDVIKSSPSVVANPHPTSQDDRYLVIAGSRRGADAKLDDLAIAPYRAVTFGSGREVWRLPAPRTAAYSRDADGSGFFIDGRQYMGLEDGWFYSLDPFATQKWTVVGATYEEPIASERRLLLGDPAAASREKPHPEGANLCIEASPALMGDVVFISSGAGHVYGLRRSDLTVVFDYRTGSDLDGTTVPTRTGKLLVPVEKQYIPGDGGVLLLDPSRPAASSVVWFFPTGNRKMSEWRGGVIGSVAVNDEYGGADRYPPLAAFIGIDGYLARRLARHAGRQACQRTQPRAGPAHTGRGVQRLAQLLRLDAHLRRRRPCRRRLRRSRAPLSHRLHPIAGGPSRSAAQPRRPVVDRQGERDRDLQGRQLLRVDAHRLAGARVHRLPRRLLLLPGRSLGQPRTGGRWAEPSKATCTPIRRANRQRVPSAPPVIIPGDRGRPAPMRLEGPMTDAHSGLSEPAAMTIDQLLARAEDLRQLIDSLRDELDDVEAELDRRETAWPSSQSSAA